MDVELNNFVQNNKDLDEYNLSQIEISIEKDKINDEKASNIKKKLKKLDLIGLSEITARH